MDPNELAALAVFRSGRVVALVGGEEWDVVENDNDTDEKYEPEVCTIYYICLAFLKCKYAEGPGPIGDYSGLC